MPGVAGARGFVRGDLPEPSVDTFTVESKRARSTGPTRRWTVPECRANTGLAHRPNVPVGDARVREHIVHVACRRFRSDRRVGRATL